MDLPDANALRAKLAQKRAARAAAEAEHHDAAESARRKWIESLEHAAMPADVAERLSRRISMAIERGESQLEALRFPRELTTDGARAINNREVGWEKTLLGAPKLALEYWAAHLRDRGYGLRAEVITFPGGMPGDCALYLEWGE
jgi:hypothetical protein